MFRRLDDFEKNLFVEFYFLSKNHPKFFNHMKDLSRQDLTNLAGRVRIFEKSKEPKHLNIFAIVTGKRIWVSRKLNLENSLHLSLILHEFVHVYQFRKYRNYFRICWQLVTKRSKRYKTTGCLENDAEGLSAFAMKDMKLLQLITKSKVGLLRQ